MNIYNVIGLMSGTSLDGIDLAYCRFEEKHGKWKSQILKAETVGYSDRWKQILSNLFEVKAEELEKADIEYANLTAEILNDFIENNNIKADFICSHGHTIFHEPSKKITLQIGNGSVIAAKTGHTVICDFRKLDVSLGGQGAPLVPIGDRLLFGEYDSCLNLGGFSNISFEKEGQRIAFDICAVNIVLNHLAEKKGKDFDVNGSIAETGGLCNELLKALNDLEYYSLNPPKSLGKEWVIKKFLPILERYAIPTEDKLRTVTEHIAIQISKVLTNNSGANVLVTGGGAYNSFLIALLKEKTTVDVVIPDPMIIEFKEALIFGLLGTLRVRNEINCLSSVTGAAEDSCAGTIYYRK